MRDKSRKIVYYTDTDTDSESDDEILRYRSATKKYRDKSIKSKEYPSIRKKNHEVHFYSYTDIGVNSESDDDIFYQSHSATRYRSKAKNPKSRKDKNARTNLSENYLSRKNYKAQKDCGRSRTEHEECQLRRVATQYRRQVKDVRQRPPSANRLKDVAGRLNDSMFKATHVPKMDKSNKTVQKEIKKFEQSGQNSRVRKTGGEKGVTDRLQKIDKTYLDQKDYQCCSIGVTQNDKIIVAENTMNYLYKPSEYTKKGGFSKSIDSYGYQNPESVIDNLNKIDPTLTKDREVILVTSKHKPKKSEECARPHAEMKLKKYSDVNGDRLVALGTSKENCGKCENKLKGVESEGRKIDGKKKNKNPKNWEEPEDIKIKTQTLKKEPTIKVTHNLDKGLINSYRKPQITRHKNIQTGIKESIKKAAKPGCGVSLTGAIESIMLADHKQKPKAYAGVSTEIAQAGSYENDICCGAAAKASAVEASAGIDGLCNASARALSVSAGIHMSKITGLSMSANAELVRAEASLPGVGIGVGLNLNNGISVGLGGVDASLLGFGLSLGPKIGIKTPFIDFSIGL